MVTPEKPLKAYSVQETCEGTGGIVFAKHAVVARRVGASIYGDGDFSGVTCRRAPWADEFADRGGVPASAAIWAGWWFECTGCGRRIDEDLPSLWESEVTADEKLAGQQLLYARWTPDHVIGDMDGLTFCRKSCEDAHTAHEAERRRRQQRAIEAFKRIILKRFPDAVIPEIASDEPAVFWMRPHHAYATMRKGRWRIEQISVSFEFPGMQIGRASLDYNPRSYDKREARRPAYRCCNGDKAAFEVWAGTTKTEAAA